MSAKIIALTANAILGVRDELLEKGFDEYLSKPIQFRELDKILKRFIPAEKIVTKTEEECGQEDIHERGRKMQPLKGADACEQALLDRAYQTLMGNLYEKEGCPWSPYRLFSPGRPRFPGVWNWDTAFHSMGVSRWDPALAREGILGFLRFQGEDGILPDVIFEDGRVVAAYSKPPVFGWAAELVYKREPNRAFLEEVYPKLVKNEQWWREQRCCDGLFYYDSADKGEPLYEKHIRYESGWDNSVRWDSFIGDQWPIDLNCFMILFYRALGFFALELGRSAEEWAARERELTELKKQMETLQNERSNKR